MSKKGKVAEIANVVVCKVDRVVLVSSDAEIFDGWDLESAEIDGTVLEMVDGGAATGEELGCELHCGAKSLCSGEARLFYDSVCW